MKKRDSDSGGKIQKDKLIEPNSKELSFLDKIKLRLVSYQYRKETPLFKMLFDRLFRYDRFYEIAINKRTYKSRFQHKSYINSKYNEFGK